MKLEFLILEFFLTKVDNNGILRVWYTSNITAQSAPSIAPQWLTVEFNLGYFYSQDANNQ